MNARGFTLAELLIALGILALIATFSIPKILSSQQDTKHNSAAKELAGAISEAYQAYKLQNTPTASMTMSNLTPYLNYVRIDSVGQIDYAYWTVGTRPCSSPNYCYHFANGSALWFNIGDSFGGTSSNRYVYFFIDPDGKVTGDGSGETPGKSIHLNLYFNGKMTDAENCAASDVTNQAGDQFWCPGGDAPPWFSWD